MNAQKITSLKRLRMLLDNILDESRWQYKWPHTYIHSELKPWGVMAGSEKNTPKIVAVSPPPKDESVEAYDMFYWHQYYYPNHPHLIEFRGWRELDFLREINSPAELKAAIEAHITIKHALED